MELKNTSQRKPHAKPVSIPSFLPRIIPNDIGTIYISGNKNLTNLDNLKNADSIFYKDADLEFLLSIQEKNDSEYSILFDALKAHQKVANLQWIIKYTNSLEISGDFNFEPLELIEWQKISWKLEWNITKKSWESDKEIPELTGDIVSINELLSSL